MTASGVVDASDLARAGGAGVLGALLLVVAVLVWPGRRPRAVVQADLTARVIPGRGPVTQGDPAAPSVWHQDPVELFRRWRLRRRTGELVDDVLELLRGIGPALEAGLTPARSIELAAGSALGDERVTRARQDQGRSRRPADIDLLVGALLTKAEQGEPVSTVWADWARRSGSAELALVAAAWQLSETTGAPLSFAVERAVRGLLDARTRRGKVAVAVAGPRATVTVLTLLPLTGPLFGLACGIDPGTLYLGSPVATACVVAGLGLVWAGRSWCTRMVRRAVRP